MNLKTEDESRMNTESEPKKSSDNIVRVANKPVANYLTAVSYKIKEFPEGIKITAFGQNLDKAFRIASQSTILYQLKVSLVDSITQKDASGATHSGVCIYLVKNRGKEHLE